MKYFETLIEDQETTVSILYQEQIIRIYSSEPKAIQRLTKELGKPTQKYIKSKTYWSGASWDIDFFALDKIQSVLMRDIFIDKKTKPIIKEEKKKHKKVTEKNKKEVSKKKKIKKVENKKNTKKEESKKKSVKKIALKKDINKNDITTKKVSENTKTKNIVNKNKKDDNKQNTKITAKKTINKKSKIDIKSKKEPISFEQIQFSF